MMNRLKSLKLVVLMILFYIWPTRKLTPSWDSLKIHSTPPDALALFFWRIVVPRLIMFSLCSLSACRNFDKALFMR